MRQSTNIVHISQFNFNSDARFVGHTGFVFRFYWFYSHTMTTFYKFNYFVNSTKMLLDSLFNQRQHASHCHAKWKFIGHSYGFSPDERFSLEHWRNSTRFIRRALLSTEFRCTLMFAYCVVQQTICINHNVFLDFNFKVYSVRWDSFQKYNKLNIKTRTNLPMYFIAWKKTPSNETNKQSSIFYVLSAQISVAASNDGNANTR